VVTTPYQSKAATEFAKKFTAQVAQARKDSSLILAVTPTVELNSCANLLLANASWLGTRLSAAQQANLIKLAEHNINPVKLKTLLKQIHQGFFPQAIHQTGAVDSLIEKYTNETLAADLTAQINTPDTPP
jgi:predicted metal-dependent hydrolase